MPEIKIKIDNENYSIQCEEGEENELRIAEEIVNKKMLIFKDETNIPRATKLLMVSLLLASENNENITVISDQKNKIVEVERLLNELEQKIEKS